MISILLHSQRHFLSFKFDAIRLYEGKAAHKPKSIDYITACEMVFVYGCRQVESEHWKISRSNKFSVTGRKNHTSKVNRALESTIHICPIFLWLFFIFIPFLSIMLRTMRRYHISKSDRLYRMLQLDIVIVLIAGYLIEHGELQQSSHSL